MLQIRIVCPPDLTPAARDVLNDQPGVINVIAHAGVVHHPDADLLEADLARECAPVVIHQLRDLGVLERGSVVLNSLETALGTAFATAERVAPGAGDDVIIWEDVVARSGDESTLTRTFVSFMTLATLLAAIGVVTDSPVTVVGAMVIGPEFGPLAAIAVGLMRRRWDVVRRAMLALVVGFPVALIITAIATALWRVTGLVDASDLVGKRQTDFIYHPGWFSLITALVAGAAGMLSLTSSRSAVLVGVFISVTTIPAAGNAAVALVLGLYSEAFGSLAQLGINMVGIVAAGYAMLVVREPETRRRAGYDPLQRTALS